MAEGDNDLGLDPEDVAKDVAARKLVGDLASESGYCLEGPVAAGADDPEGVCRVLIQGNQDLTPGSWVTNDIVCDEVAHAILMDAATTLYQVASPTEGGGRLVVRADVTEALVRALVRSSVSPAEIHAATVRQVTARRAEDERLEKLLGESEADQDDSED